MKAVPLTFLRWISVSVVRIAGKKRLRRIESYSKDRLKIVTFLYKKESTYT